MAYRRKTTDEYDVEGFYASGWEVLCCEETLREARARVREYQANDRGNYRIRKNRVPIIA